MASTRRAADDVTLYAARCRHTQGHAGNCLPSGISLNGSGDIGLTWLSTHSGYFLLECRLRLVSCLLKMVIKVPKVIMHKVQ